MTETMKMMLVTALVGILATIPSVLIQLANYIKVLAAVELARQAKDASLNNSKAIEIVHATINSNREKDMAMAAAGGQATGIMMERDAAMLNKDKFDELINAARCKAKDTLETAAGKAEQTLKTADDKAKETLVAADDKAEKKLEVAREVAVELKSHDQRG